MGNIRLGDAPASTEYRSQSLQNGALAFVTDANVPSRTYSRSPSDSNTHTSDGAATQDATRPVKLLRKSSHRPIKREPPLFGHLPDSTEEACQNFKVIPDCLYGSKNMGSTDNDALDCDCKEDWHDGVNYACGEDCINRATRVECVIGASGSCGDRCQNQRFQRKQYADLSVIKTEKKGYGLRANTDLEANDFIHEYVGEVINEPTFRRRMHQYDDEGIKHFYFMSLTKSEFVDATKKGNLGRFCNHSCNPNCYVDKWVVGDKMRMGIFVLRRIKAGEELTFNYNVDRYGADPQPCYCGEPECSGFIGGKTQTEKATKLPILVIEALGIDDADGWDTTVSKKPRKKRSDEDDEEYVNSVQAKSLDSAGARKVMAALMQCKEKWIAVKLLERIQNCDDDYVLNSVMRMHAYQIMKTMINSFMDDDNVLLQVLNVLDKMPRLTKNKIVDSNIEATILGLTESHNEDVVNASRRLLDDWGRLQVAYRIKRRKIDPNAPTTTAAELHRGAVLGVDRDPEPTTPASKPVSPLPNNIEIPKGPRSSIPQRNYAFPRNRPFNQPRHGYQHQSQNPNQQHRHLQHPSMNGQNAGSSLPTGWFVAANDEGRIYYYTEQGMTTWVRPTVKAPTKAELHTQTLQKIIDDAIKAPVEKTGGRSEGAGSSHTTPDSEMPSQEAGTEKWRSLPLEKQMKIYENTLFPHVKHVLDKFRHRLPREELKKFAKELNKKLAASDYKNNRVQDPTAAIPERQARKVKQYVKEFLDKAVVKFVDFERKKAARDAANATSNGEKGGAALAPAAITTSVPASGKEDVPMTDVTPEAGTTPDTGAREPQSPCSPILKRKRKPEDGESSPVDEQCEQSRSPKPTKELVDAEAAPPPPPPPPPPEEETGANAGMEPVLTEEERDLRAQEEALMRENEEAQRLEDEALGAAARAETVGNSVPVG